ncbi:MAG TPA: HDOD domain-containing protein [Synergistaceae bacterium]|nr:HDOD domain-containing protein [Synergistaceae bacterium]
MKYIHVDDLSEGMVLASDLAGPGGRVMLQKGAVIKENYLRSLKVWGVSGAYVESEEEETPGSELSFSGISSDQVEAIYAFLRLRGGGKLSENHPMIREVFRVAAERMAREALDAGGVFRKEIPLPERPSIYVSRKENLTLEGLLRTPQKLFSLPDIYFKIKQVIDSPKSSAAHIARVVEKDTSLSAKLLQIVNSALYGFPSRIDTIARAVTIIGSRELASLSLAVSVTSLFKGIPKAFIDMRSFWEHSVATGVFARVLADKGQFKGDEDRLFVAGILHDIGRIFLFRHAPAEMADAMVLALQKKIPLLEAEHEEFGFTHALIGGKLLEQWKIPKVLWDSVRYHHLPERAENQMIASVLHVADFMANVLSLGTGGSYFFPPFSEKAWDTIGIDASEVENVILQGERQVKEIIHIFLKEPTA